MIKKIIPILAVLLVIGVFSANYVYNNNSDANLSDSNIEDVATTGVDTLLNTATSDNTDDIYDKIIENKDMNKNNIITNTLNESNTVKDLNGFLLNNNNPFTNSITPGDALVIVEDKYPLMNFNNISSTGNGDYIISNGTTNVRVNSKNGNIEGEYSVNETPMPKNNINKINSINNHNVYNATPNVDYNLLNPNSQDKLIHFDYESVSYTTSITPNQALSYASKEYPDKNFTEVIITDYGDYIVSDNQTSIFVDSHSGHIDGGFSVNEAPSSPSEVQKAINDSNVAQNITQGSDDSVQVNDTAFNSTDLGSAVNDTPIGEIVSNASDFVNSVNDSIDPADKA